MVGLINCFLTQHKRRPAAAFWIVWLERKLGEYNEVVDFDFGDEAALAAGAVKATNEFAFNGQMNAFCAIGFEDFCPAAPSRKKVPLTALAHDAVGVEVLLFGS